MKNRPPKTQQSTKDALGRPTFDLGRLQLTDLDGISIDSDGELSVTVMLPVGNGEAQASYEESFDLDDEETPLHVREAAHALSVAVVRAVLERELVSGDLPCETCNSKCCRTFESIRVTKADVERLEANGIRALDAVTFHPDETWNGYVGELKLEDRDGEPTCQFLGQDGTGCQIYGHRPLTCREFSAWTCGIWEEDPEKSGGKVRLKVVP